MVVHNGYIRPVHSNDALPDPGDARPMPKANPKRASIQKRYYQRQRAVRASDTPRDHTPVYFGILFVGIIAGIIAVVWIFTQTADTSLTVRVGDVIDIRYVGRYDNGTRFDEGVLNDQEVGNNNLLPYFDQQLVGLKVNTQSTFVVPAAFGYTTPGHDLYGYNLNFEVTVIKLVRGGQMLFPEPA